MVYLGIPKLALEQYCQRLLRLAIIMFMKLLYFLKPQFL